MIVDECIIIGSGSGEVVRLRVVQPTEAQIGGRSHGQRMHHDQLEYLRLRYASHRTISPLPFCQRTSFPVQTVTPLPVQLIPIGLAWGQPMVASQDSEGAKTSRMHKDGGSVTV